MTDTSSIRMAWIRLTIIDLYKNITKVEVKASGPQLLAKLIIGAFISWEKM